MYLPFLAFSCGRKLSAAFWLFYFVRENQSNTLQSRTIAQNQKKQKNKTKKNKKNTKKKKHYLITLPFVYISKSSEIMFFFVFLVLVFLVVLVLFVLVFLVLVFWLPTTTVSIATTL